MFPGAFQNLRLLALDPYDLALTKLERNIVRDQSDVRFLARAIPFDIDLLRGRYQTELRTYLGNPKREDLTLKLWIEAIEEDRAVESSRLHESHWRLRPKISVQQRDSGIGRRMRPKSTPGGLHQRPFVMVCTTDVGWL